MLSLHIPWAEAHGYHHQVAPRLQETRMRPCESPFSNRHYALMPTKSDRGLLRILFAALAFVVGSAGSTPAGAASLGNNFEISGPGCRFPDVAFGSANSQYLVVWPDYNALRIFGRFVTPTGTVSGPAFPISEAPFGSLY